MMYPAYQSFLGGFRLNVLYLYCAALRSTVLVLKRGKEKEATVGCIRPFTKSSLLGSVQSRCGAGLGWAVAAKGCNGVHLIQPKRTDRADKRDR